VRLARHLSWTYVADLASDLHLCLPTIRNLHSINCLVHRAIPNFTAHGIHLSTLISSILHDYPRRTNASCAYHHISDTKTRWQHHLVDPKQFAHAARHTTHFAVGSASHPYTVIHPLTPLEDLEGFFTRSGTDFALGTSIAHLFAPLVLPHALSEGHFVNGLPYKEGARHGESSPSATAPSFLIELSRHSDPRV
jgi:hypothetical protein